MPDSRVINSRTNVAVELPSGYDRFYRQLILPYNYQNVDKNSIKSNAQVINAEIEKGIEGVSELRWVRAISKEFVSNELDGTFEKDILDNYGKLIQDYYGLGNWDLTENPQVSISGNGYSNLGSSILYPQAGLFWNSFYNKYFAVWYTPIQRFKNNAIISKSSAENYIKQLSQTSSYLLNDTNGIILRATEELGFSPIDVLSVNDNPTIRVQKLLEALPLWSAALSQAQAKYQELKTICEDEKFKKQYLFLDEDTNLFSPTRKSYFVFKVDRNYYEDLTGDWNLTDTPEYWSSIKDYKAGDYVLGSGAKDRNFIYRCVRSHTAEEMQHTFKQKVTIKKKVTGSNEPQEVIVDQWVLVSNDYAKELEAINKAYGSKFNANDWVRFVFPQLEDLRPDEYYTNGVKKPSLQHGRILWGQDGITLRPITHKYITEEDWEEAKEYNANLGEDEEPMEPKVSTLVNYSTEAIIPENTELKELKTDTTNPLDPYITEKPNYTDEGASPTTSEISFYDSSRKIIHYLKKSQLPAIFYIIMECKINKVNDESFAGREDLLKVVLRSTVKSIGNSAFYNCVNLQHAVLPKNLTGLGIKAFAACTNIKRASIPNGVARLQATYIGCTKLQSVALSDNMEELGDSTFMNCTALEHIYNIKSIKQLGTGVFNNCSNLKEITIPAAVTELPSRLFKNCTNVKITLENNEPTLVGESCFEGCEQITQPVSFKNVTELYPATYKNCINLSYINFDFNPQVKEKDVPHLFCYGCYKLKEVNLGAVTSLGDSSFQNCSLLSEITIPSTVKRLGSYVFYDCFRLGKVNIPVRGTSGAWIEEVLDSTNRNNWVDPTITRVLANGAVVKWQLTTI